GPRADRPHRRAGRGGHGRGPRARRRLRARRRRRDLRGGAHERGGGRADRPAREGAEADQHVPGRQDPPGPARDPARAGLPDRDHPLGSPAGGHPGHGGHAERDRARRQQRGRGRPHGVVHRARERGRHRGVAHAGGPICNGRDPFMSEREGVLAGIRVLDFGRYIAGPYCAALLADLGADVIRIERRSGGEDRWVAPVSEDGSGAMYLVMNRNKRAMTLDPSSPEGREIVRKLVAGADVVVANLPPEVLRSLALDLDSLRRVKPDIILTTVTAFGAGGPWSGKHGFDGIGQTMSGGAYLTGTPEQPMRAAVPWVDCGTASLAALGTLAALMERGKTGRGQKVEGALLRTAVAFNNPALLEQGVVQPN